jgi:hypothetical protein
VNVTVQGWTQSSGELWPVNALSPVRASRLLGVEGDLIITQVEYSIGEQGKVTQLRLMRPDAFTPEPKAIVQSPAKKRGSRGGNGNWWKEEKKGGL